MQAQRARRRRWLLPVAASMLWSPFTVRAAEPPMPVPPVGSELPSPLCAPLLRPAGSLEETAWRLFAHAFCPKDGKLTLETWTEQTCLLHPETAGCTQEAPGGRFLHGSHLLLGKLRQVERDGAPKALPPCQAMTTASAGGVFKPFVPGNLSSAPVFCEEVFVNDAEVAYINAPPGLPGTNLRTLSGQARYVAAKGKLDFPTEALEVKIDWLPATSLVDARQRPAFDCDQNRPAGVYTETINGQCYALVGVHISSKLYPNWLWATFEPQSAMTNPNRCNAKLYSNCVDPWGSRPAASTGSSTAATPALMQLMAGARLAPEFLNYRLVGVQTAYDQPHGTRQLGNSFVEFNAQVPPGKASCITCHAYAMFNASTNPPKRNGNFGPFPGTPAIGTPGTPPPTVPPAQWTPQDFSWLLGIMPAVAGPVKE